MDNKTFMELYSDSEYEKPSVTVDAVIFRLCDKISNNYRKLPEKKLQVYLTKRAYAPYQDVYSIVGTFIDLKLELSDSLKMCVLKKVNLQNYYYEQLFTFGNPERDPRNRVLSVSYMLLTNQESVIENGEWFDIDISSEVVNNEQTSNGYKITKKYNLTLSNENKTLNNEICVDIDKNNLEQLKNVSIINTALAFDHAKIIFYALERLKNKLEYTDIIFNLLPKEFSLTELKNSYEVILGQKLLDANFRRKTSKLVAPTSNYITGKGHRSSQLFTHNHLWDMIDID